MTMLTHSGGPFMPARHSSGGRDAAETGTAHSARAIVQRFCMHALAMLALGGVATAVVAIKTASFFWRHHF